MPNANHSSWYDFLYQFLRERGEQVVLGQFRNNMSELSDTYQVPGGNNLYRHSNFFGYFIKNNSIQNDCVSVESAGQQIAAGSQDIFLFPIEIEWGNLKYLAEDGLVVKDHLGRNYTYKLKETFTPDIVHLTKTRKLYIVIANMVDPALATMYYDIVDKRLENLGIPTEQIVWLGGHKPSNAFRPDRKSRSIYLETILSLVQAAENYLKYPCVTSLNYYSDIVRPADLDINKKRAKRFLCFNRSMNRPYRMAMAHMALKHNLLEDSIFSFVTSLTLRYMKEFLTPYMESNDDIDYYVDAIQKLVPYEIDTHHLTDQQKQSFHTVDNNRKDLYDSTYFHIVTETIMGNEPSCFISEKTWRPILNLQPFVYFGDHGALKKLKELGFKTFDDIIDESYDNELDAVKRFMMAKAEVLKLKAMTMNDIHKLYYSVVEKLIHNQQFISTYLEYDPLNELEKLKNIKSRSLEIRVRADDSN
jgi:hypothetical protein